MKELQDAYDTGMETGKIQERIRVLGLIDIKSTKNLDEAKMLQKIIEQIAM